MWNIWSVDVWMRKVWKINLGKGWPICWSDEWRDSLLMESDYYYMRKCNGKKISLTDFFLHTHLTLLILIWEWSHFTDTHKMVISLFNFFDTWTLQHFLWVSTCNVWVVSLRFTVSDRTEQMAVDLDTRKRKRKRERERKKERKRIKKRKERGS